MERINAKTLLILGEQDNPIGNPKKNAKYAKMSIKDIEVITLNTGHLISIEQPERVNSILFDFLKK